ncbi:MAG: hypothetical protein JXQ90_15050 [Cyclobacteriaceae bacterium]
MLSKIFGKKKKEFKAHCELSKLPLDKSSTYVISTAEIVSSRKFWDNKMTEPETLSYTEAHFKNGDSTARNIRGMIYQKYAGVDKPWVISDSQLHLFDIDVDRAKENGDKWWEAEGSFTPENGESSLAAIDASTVDEMKNYAIMEAGRNFVTKQ